MGKEGPSRSSNSGAESGPHFRLTRDEVQITPEIAEYAADLIAEEEARKAAAVSP